MRCPKRSQYKYAKSRYQVRNWADYETGLQRRGALTVWLSDTALEAWRAPATGRPGGQPTYSDLAIEAPLTIHMIFRLPLRQTEGFLRSLASLLGLSLPIPDHTTLSRRLRKLGHLQMKRPPAEEPIHHGGRGLRYRGSLRGCWEEKRRPASDGAHPSRQGSSAVFKPVARATGKEPEHPDGAQASP